MANTMLTADKVNADLLNLYKSKYELLSNELIAINKKLEDQGLPQERATNPLLLTVNQQYLDSDFKIMFFGQETNYWLEERNSGAFLEEISEVMKLYNSFYWENGYYSYRSYFWNGIKNFLEKIKTKKNNGTIGAVWNNVVKIGKCEVGFPDYIYETEKKYFNILLEEIEIIKPDAIVFFSGPNYDDYIADAIGSFTIIPLEGFSERQLSIIHTDKIGKAFRTYHPGYLYRKGIDKYLDAIVEQL